jgi:hypothetical protein
MTIWVFCHVVTNILPMVSDAAGASKPMRHGGLDLYENRYAGGLSAAFSVKSCHDPCRAARTLSGCLCGSHGAFSCARALPVLRFFAFVAPHSFGAWRVVARRDGLPSWGANVNRYKISAATLMCRTLPTG